MRLNQGYKGTILLRFEAYLNQILTLLYLYLMYYRRKVIVQLLSALGGSVERLRMQKLLFLFCQQQERAVYHFLPYRYGAFSLGIFGNIRNNLG